MEKYDFAGQDSRLWKSTLPRPEDFSKALYTVDIGQNDIALVVQETNTTDKKLQASIPNVLEKFSQAIQVSENITVFLVFL